MGVRFAFIPVALAAVGIVLIIADETSYQMERNAPVSCPEGMFCDSVVVRELALTVIGALLLVGGGIAFALGRVSRLAKTRPSVSG